MGEKHIFQIYASEGAIRRSDHRLAAITALEHAVIASAGVDTTSARAVIQYLESARDHIESILADLSDQRSQ